jgi:hypothetical protein
VQGEQLSGAVITRIVRFGRRPPPDWFLARLTVVSLLAMANGQCPPLRVPGISRGWAAVAQSRMSLAQGPRHFLDYGT